MPSCRCLLSYVILGSSLAWRPWAASIQAQSMLELLHFQENRSDVPIASATLKETRKLAQVGLQSAHSSAEPEKDVRLSLLQASRVVANPDVKRNQDGMGSAITEGQQKATGRIEALGTQQDEELSPEIHTSTVLLLTMFMAAAAGLGALPFFFVGSLSKEWSALANAVACGVMLACSFDLMHEGQPYGGSLVVIGILIGAVFISASQQWLEQFEDVKFQGLQGMNARKIMLMIGIMAAHAFGEGAGVGVSFCGSRGWAQGVLVTLAIGLHNIPEGLAVSTVLVARGISPKHALLWTLFTSMPQPLVALPSFLFVDTFRVLLPVALGFAAGCMVWMVFAELLPDALADASHGKVATVGTFSAAWLEGLRMMLATLEGGNGRILVPGALSGAVLKSGLLLTLPAVAAGILGGRMGAALAKDRVAATGLAAGILVWQGAADLANTLAFSGSAKMLPLFTAAAIGSIAVVLLGRTPSLWPTGTQKEKEGNTPVRASSSQIEVAAEQNGFDDHCLDSGSAISGMGSADIDVELAVVAKRVFSPYQRRVQSVQWTLIATGIIALLAQAIGNGFRISQAASTQMRSASLLWVPTTLRSLLPGAAIAALLGQKWGRRSVSLTAASVAGLAPVTGVLERLRTDITEEGNSLAIQIVAAASGAALTAGLWTLFPAAQAMSQRRALKGLIKGVLVSCFVYCLLGLLCWTSPYCIR